MDRFNVNTSLSRNWEHVNTKFVGTGHPDISRHELASHVHRDTNATLLGHHDMLLFASTVEGVTCSRMRYKLLEKQASPCGPAPAVSPAATLAKAALAKSGAAASAGGGGAAGATGLHFRKQ
jgi:splicing factor 3B subunit 5